MFHVVLLMKRLRLCQPVRRLVFRVTQDVSRLSHLHWHDDGRRADAEVLLNHFDVLTHREDWYIVRILDHRLKEMLLMVLIGVEEAEEEVVVVQQEYKSMLERPHRRIRLYQILGEGTN